MTRVQFLAGAEIFSFTITVTTLTFGAFPAYSADICGSFHRDKVVRV
jgi:hypothetical protein